MYTDWETVANVLAPDGDTDGTAASLGQEDIEEAIRRVSSRVDTFLAMRYTTPIPDELVPGIIKDITTDIAAYDLTLAYYKGTDISDQDPVIRRYKDARGMLGQLSTGLLIIDVPGLTDTTRDDPVVYNPVLPVQCSPPHGLEWRVVREIGPWGDGR